jgi:hypothetical protein
MGPEEDGPTSKDNKELDDCDKEIVGKTFGKLTVLPIYKVRKFGKKKTIQIRIYKCNCECGGTKLVSKSHLQTGHTVRCGRPGCRVAEELYNWSGDGELSGTHWWGIRRHARDRGLEFAISIAYAWDLFEKQGRKCSLTGQLLEMRIPAWTKNGDLYWHRTASLDRIDSSKGYTEGNVQWVHKDVNAFKMDRPEKDFVALCLMVAETARLKMTSKAPETLTGPPDEPQNLADRPLCPTCGRPQ